VIAETGFEERIMMVGDILGEELPTIQRKSTNFTKSLGEEGEKRFKRLPPSSGLGSKMNEFMNELTAAEGSVRSRKTKESTAYEVGRLPPRPKMKMQFYDIAECTWQVKAPSSQKALLKSKLYPHGGNPNLYVSWDRMSEWESMGRECISMLSHLDHFVAANAKLARTMFQKMEDGVKMSEEEIWNFARMGMCMSYSAGMAIQDIAKNVIWQVGEENITRRDAFLEKMKKNLPDGEVLKLRASDLNGPQLFDEEQREAAERIADGRSKDKLQSTLVYKALSLKEDNVKSDSRNKGADKGRFKKATFQRYDGGEADERKGESERKSDYKPYKSGTASNSSSNRGKGGFSRTQRGGRGRFGQKRFTRY
jgi:hypothetical protein